MHAIPILVNMGGPIGFRVVTRNSGDLTICIFIDFSPSGGYYSPLYSHHNYQEN